MAAISVHKEHIKEHLESIESAIAIGVENRSATIGLHTSACSIALLELYLHALGKIPLGRIIKHDWFKAPKTGQKVIPIAERNLGADFPLKDKLLPLMYSIEEQRNKLVYGKPSKEIAKAVLDSFQELHKLIKEKLKELGEEIE